MGLHFALSTQQINSIASDINLKDIQDYISTHQAEYEQYLKEENKPDSKQFKKYTTGKTRDSKNKRKIYRTNPCIVWHEYKEEQKHN